MSVGEDRKQDRWNGWQVVQAIISGLVLIVLSGVYNSYNTYASSQQDTARSLVLVQATQTTQGSDLVDIKKQLAQLPEMNGRLIEIKTKLDDDERRISEVELPKRANK